MKVKRVRLNDHDWHHLSDSDEAKWGYNEAIVWLGLVIVSIIVVGLKPARLGGLVLHGDCYINRRIWQIPYTKEYTNTMSFKFSQLSALLHLAINVSDFVVEVGDAHNRKPARRWTTHYRGDTKNGGPVHWISENYVCPNCMKSPNDHCCKA